MILSPGYTRLQVVPHGGSDVGGGYRRPGDVADHRPSDQGNQGTGPTGNMSPQVTCPHR